MDVTLSVDGRPFSFSGETDDPWFKIWRDAGFYGYRRDIVPFRRAIRPTSICLDVGANIGLTAVVMASSCPKGAVYCFEPIAQNFHHLRRTIELNQLSNCHAVNAAVGERAGQTRMLAAGPHSQVRSDGGEPVSVVTIDEWCAESGIDRIDFMKIDVEGYERAVLAGAAQTLNRQRPCVFIEFNSLTTIFVGEVTPFVLLDDLMSIFPYVAQVDREMGEPQLLGRTCNDRRAFIYHNMMTRGLVDDLLCYFHPDQIDQSDKAMAN